MAIVDIYTPKQNWELMDKAQKVSYIFNNETNPLYVNNKKLDEIIYTQNLVKKIRKNDKSKSKYAFMVGGAALLISAINPIASLVGYISLFGGICKSTSNIIEKDELEFMLERI